MNIAETYFRELRDIHSSGSAVKETSYYGPLANLLNAVGKQITPRVQRIIHLQNQGAGIPDGGLFTEDQPRVKERSNSQKVTTTPTRQELRALAVISTTAKNGQLNSAQDLGITAKWGHYGKDNAIMPAKGKIITCEYSLVILRQVEFGDGKRV